MISDFANTIEYMDHISDNNFLYQAFHSMEILLKYLKNNTNAENEKILRAEFEEMQKDKLEKYLYKDISVLITDIENDLYTVCLRLQSYSNDLHLHQICVKTFLFRGKILLSLKSLLFLQNNFSNSFEYLDSLHNFNHYLTDNKHKIPCNYLEIIHEKVNLFRSEETLQKFLNDAKIKYSQNININGEFIEGILTDAYESIFYNKKTIENVLESLIENDQISLRKIRREVIIKNIY